MAGYCDIWDALATTDKNYTKDFKKAGGFGGTDINPQWRMRRMTEQFGPVGVGWGYEVKRTWREDFGNTPFVFAEVVLWYYPSDTDEQPAMTGPQIGGTDASRASDEAYKMAITDGLGKCMAQIGLAADVYLGEFDTKYSREPNTKSPPSNGQRQQNNGSDGGQKDYSHEKATYSPKTWQEVKFVRGKNEGMTLGELDDNSIHWWNENWVPSKDYDKLNGDDKLLYRGLKAALKALEESQNQQREEPAIPEDCPF